MGDSPIIKDLKRFFDTGLTRVKHKTWSKKIGDSSIITVEMSDRAKTISITFKNTVSHQFEKAMFSYDDRNLSDRIVDTLAKFSELARKPVAALLEEGSPRLSKEEWLKVTDAELKRRYAIGFEDAGTEDDWIENYYRDYLKGETIKDFAIAFGDDSDLDDQTEGWGISTNTTPDPRIYD